MEITDLLLVVGVMFAIELLGLMAFVDDAQKLSGGQVKLLCVALLVTPFVVPLGVLYYHANQEAQLIVGAIIVACALITLVEGIRHKGGSHA